jgi:primosomal protein N'
LHFFRKENIEATGFWGDLYTPQKLHVFEGFCIFSEKRTFVFVKTIVENYPELSKYFFTYQVPTEMESKIQFGTRILVPFGLANVPRLAYVIDQYETLEGLEGNKKIIAVLTDLGEFAPSQFRFLQFISIYFFIPISTVVKNCGLFSKSSKPTVFYQLLSFNQDLLKKLRNSERIEKYLNSHDEGFLAKDLRRYLGLKKASTIPIKLEKLGILKKTYLSTKIQLSKPQPQNGKGEVVLCNGLSFFDRLNEYKEFIIKNNYQQVLFISPNKKYRDKAKKWFSENGDTNIQFGSKFSLLSLVDFFDFIIIDDCNNGEYRINKPIAFDLEKVAKIRSFELNTPIILGSFIPSITSYRDLQSGSIKHLNQPKKDLQKKYPLLIIRSQPKEIEKHGFSFIPFSIQYEIKRNLLAHKKSVILTNRKGYFNLLACRDCGFTAKCTLCGIPLSYHPQNKKLVCHYCGMSIPEYEKCPTCSGIGLHYAVCGTEKIEKEAKRLFPNEKIIRIDSNSIQNFSDKELDFSIAIGTSMLLDIINFEDIDFCCVLGIDSLLNFPVYRSQEATLQYIASIFEKMINNHGNGKRIIIPTFTPYAEIFRHIQSRSINLFYQTELENRQELKYPPFADLVKISLESNNKDELPPVINRLLKALKKIDGLDIISTKPLLQSSPFGIFSAEILLRSSDILNIQDQIAVMIDEFKKNEKIDVLIRNME